MTDVKSTEEATRSVGMERAEGHRNALQGAVERLTAYAGGRLDVYGTGVEAFEAMCADLRLVLSSLVEARENACAFAAVWAVEYARQQGYPPGHLSPGHYDILASHGARMDAFTRHERQALRSMEGKNV